MTQIRQIGFQAFCNHNPQMQTCCAKGCETVLFGEVHLLQLENEQGRTRTWEMCSVECYKKVDTWIEEYLSSELGDDLIAIIDGGIPEEWGP